jgi:tryptophan synthase
MVRGAAAVTQAIESAQKQSRAAFVAYLTAGIPHPDKTVELLLALQAGGADIIELGVPFSDPLADGPVIQLSNQIALSHNVTYADCLDIVTRARAAGLSAPVVLMGYYNPLIAYGEVQAVADAKKAGADAFIVVDLPVEEAGDFVQLCKKNSLSYIPLAALTTRVERLSNIASTADSFIYCVSVTGVTGSRVAVNNELPAFLKRMRDACGEKKVPLAVGFGISTPEQFNQVAKMSEAVVMGSALIKLITDNIEDPNLAKRVTDFAASVCGKKVVESAPKSPKRAAAESAEAQPKSPKRARHN